MCTFNAACSTGCSTPSQPQTDDSSNGSPPSSRRRACTAMAITVSWHRMRPCAQRSARWPGRRQRHRGSQPLPRRWVARGTGARSPGWTDLRVSPTGDTGPRGQAATGSWWATPCCGAVPGPNGLLTRRVVAGLRSDGGIPPRARAPRVVQPGVPGSR